MQPRLSGLIGAGAPRIESRSTLLERYQIECAALVPRSTCRSLCVLGFKPQAVAPDPKGAVLGLSDTWALASGQRTDVGRVRSVNEDSFVSDDGLGIYLVADGMGGHAEGKTASEMTVKTVLRTLEASRCGGTATLPTLPNLRLAFRLAHLEILARTRKEPVLQGMGTTLAALVLDADRHSAAIAHVGDSPIYLWRDGRLRRLTLDHSLVAELVVRRRLSPAEAREHPHRNVLTRAIGMHGRMEPDTALLGTAPGDLFLLCSDGVSSQISEDEIAEIVAAAADDLDAAAGALIERSNESGGSDNATAILVLAG